MAKKIKGFLKIPGSNGPSAHSTPVGFREPWKTGKATYAKRWQRIAGPNRPST